MTDALKDISTSVAQFYKRFGLGDESVPPVQRRRYLAEEYQEFIEESVLWSDCGDSGSYTKLASEFADVLYTLIGVMQAHGFEQAALESAIKQVCAKNDAKTPENGWKVVNNKVRFQPDNPTPATHDLADDIPF